MLNGFYKMIPMEGNMESNTKEKKLQISKIFIFIGVALLAVGIIMLIIGISKYSAIKKQYDIDLAAWRELFLNHQAGLDSKPDMPGFPILAIAGGFIAFFGLPCLFIGLRPILMKMTAKMHSETMDYAGQDIAEAGTKTIDVAKPIINKGAEVITPVVGNFAGTLAESISSGINSGKARLICPHCKKRIPEDSAFCPKCGGEIPQE